MEDERFKPVPSLNKHSFAKPTRRVRLRISALHDLKVFYRVLPKLADQISSVVLQL